MQMQDWDGDSRAFALLMDASFKEQEVTNSKCRLK